MTSSARRDGQGTGICEGRVAVLQRLWVQVIVFVDINGGSFDRRRLCCGVRLSALPSSSSIASPGIVRSSRSVEEAWRLCKPCAVEAGVEEWCQCAREQARWVSESRHICVGYIYALSSVLHLDFLRCISGAGSMRCLARSDMPVFSAVPTLKVSFLACFFLRPCSYLLSTTIALYHRDIAIENSAPTGFQSMSQVNLWQK